MVSKLILKRRKSKQQKPKNRHLLKRSPSKSDTKRPSFISSINKSIKLWSCSFSNLFSNLSSSSNVYYRLHQKEEHQPSQKPTLFLDLDETLVHSTVGPPAPAAYDFTVRPSIDGVETTFYVAKRPGVDRFLESVGSRYEVVVFTAGLKEYASMVVDELDKKEVVGERLYRDSCRLVEGRFVKDLRGRGRDFRRMVIVDDNPWAYSLHPENAVPVKPFVGDLEDREMYRLLSFFEDCFLFDDLRDAVKSCFCSGEDGEFCGV